jgi:hypothetical protein
VGRFGGVYVLLAGVAPLAVQLDGDDLEVAVLVLVAEGLPDRQVEAAASPR